MSPACLSMRIALRSTFTVSSSSASRWVAEITPPGLPLKSTPPVIIANRNLSTILTKIT
jgi:hypothetical protein